MVDEIARNIEQLANRIRARANDAQVEYTAFKAGGVMLDVRRDGRLFVMAYSPSRGFGVDEVRDGEGLQTSYRYAYPDFDAAAERLIELSAVSNVFGDPEADAVPPTLNLFVVYSADVETSKAFYEQFGIRFDKERHGSGPEHYAGHAGSATFEIYPCQRETSDSPAARLGFQVPSVDEIFSRLRTAGAKIISAPKDSPWGRRAVVCDPDGYFVEITSANT